MAPGGLSLGDCATGSYPYGVAVFRGYYTLSYLSAAKDVLAFPIQFRVPGPNETAQSIGPMSSLTPLGYGGQIYANQGNTQSCSGGPGIVGTCSVASIGSNRPGACTLVAGDEWGDVAILNFNVES